MKVIENDIIKKDCYVFVRIKDNDHCLRMIHNNRVFEVIWKHGTSAILHRSYCMYKCDRDWLVTHPLLSFFTEIQLIKIKPMAK